MAGRLQVTVGRDRADFVGADDLAIQAAVDFVALRGGGTVRIGKGTYRLHNSVRLRSGVSLVGSGLETVLFKEPSTTVPLTDDTDWYDHHVTVADPSPFRVGGGILLQATCPHSGSEQVIITTVLGIQGHRLDLASQARGPDGGAHRGNFWVGHSPTASTLFSLVTANWATDLRVADLAIDGNRGRSAYLNGNYGAALYFQDCERVLVENVEVAHIESDCLSFQVVHDLTVRDCRFLDAVQGVHAGSGSQRPVIRGNLIRGATGNGGLVWCWGVRHGLAEDNTIEDCAIGINIGHRDTDNIMRGNAIRRCTQGGLVYRPDPPHQAAHDNRVEGNLFEDIGTPDKPGCGIDIGVPVHGNVLRANHIACTRPGLMHAGICIGPTAGENTLADNTVEGIAMAVEDRRPARGSDAGG